MLLLARSASDCYMVKSLSIQRLHNACVVGVINLGGVRRSKYGWAAWLRM